MTSEQESHQSVCAEIFFTVNYCLLFQSHRVYLEYGACEREPLWLQMSNVVKVPQDFMEFLDCCGQKMLDFPAAYLYVMTFYDRYSCSTQVN